MDTDSKLSFIEVCKQLGREPQFLLELAATANDYYEHFERRKRAGGTRTIHASLDKLKRLQRRILDFILTEFPMPDHVHGSVKGRSIITNAAPHVGRPVVVNLDLSNFFGTVTTERVKSIFQNYFGLDEEAALVLARICTLYGTLPQGAPTSPALANLAALELDAAIIQLCAKNLGESMVRYTRYIDDLTFSGEPIISKLIPDITNVVEQHGFTVNSRKTQVLGRSQRQSVTGIVVNEKVNVPRKLVRKARQHLYYCRKFGVDDHSETLAEINSVYFRKLVGLIGYIKMVRPEIGEPMDWILRRDVWITEIDETERTVFRLRTLIQEEQTVVIVCGKESRRIVPDEIDVDKDGIWTLSGFELHPEKGRRKYQISEITSLEPDKMSYR